MSPHINYINAFSPQWHPPLSLLCVRSSLAFYLFSGLSDSPAINCLSGWKSVTENWAIIVNVTLEFLLTKS